MSTLLWCGKTRKLVADRRLSEDSRFFDSCPKVGRVAFSHRGALSGQVLIGGVGSACDIRAFQDWVDSGMPKEGKPVLEGSEAVLAYPDGDLDVFVDRGYFRLEKPAYYATGSGGSAALGALLAGADPVAAVVIASRLDNTTGPTVDAVGFDEAEDDGA